jgi:hypothetical protein
MDQLFGPATAEAGYGRRDLFCRWQGRVAVAGKNLLARLRQNASQNEM